MILGLNETGQNGRSYGQTTQKRSRNLSEKAGKTNSINKVLPTKSSRLRCSFLFSSVPDIGIGTDPNS